MIRFFYSILSLLLIVSCNQNSSQTEREYIKNLEEKNNVLEKELRELKGSSDSNNTSRRTKQKAASKDYFTIGSTEQEVIDIMGTPTSYIDFSFDKSKRYNYGNSIVVFKKGKVESYNNAEGNLKVRIN